MYLEKLLKLKVSDVMTTMNASISVCYSHCSP